MRRTTRGVAPSEIPGLTVPEASAFGRIPELILGAEFQRQYGPGGPSVFLDHNSNEKEYLAFLARHNVQLRSPARLQQFTATLRAQLPDPQNPGDTKPLTVQRPDLMVHQPGAKAFYEIKPLSPDGLRKGEIKVGTLRGVTIKYNLPYLPGTEFRFEPSHTLARLEPHLHVELKTQYADAGLLVYHLDLEGGEGVRDLAFVMTVLAAVVRDSLRQAARERFDPIDLRSVFGPTCPLWEMARRLGWVAEARSTGWKYFWRAAAKRFAARGALAARLSTLDGPLLFGELAGFGLGFWTAIEIIRDQDAIWREARHLAQREPG